MIACSMTEEQDAECKGPAQWWHIDCLDIKEDDLERTSFFCKPCFPNHPTGKFPGGKCCVVPVVLPDWKSAAAGVDLAMPAAGETRLQFWSQPFRQAIKKNSGVFKRSPGEVFWDEFPGFKARVASLNNDEGAAEVDAAIGFVHGFVHNLNERLNERNDLEFLEACTLFDPRPQFKIRNKDMQGRYLQCLLSRFQVADARATKIKFGMASWFNEDNKIELAENGDCIEHFFGFVKGSNHGMEEFASFALEVLKCLVATAVVESGFSFTTMMKNKHRSLLDLEKIRGMVLMKDEPPLSSMSHASFFDYWSRIKLWLHEQGLIKPVRKRRSAYAVTNLRRKLKETHAVSEAYV